MSMVNIADLKSNLSSFIKLVEAGDELVVCRHNVPVARIVPVRARQGNRTHLGWALGQGEIHDDLQGPFMKACSPRRLWRRPSSARRGWQSASGQSASGQSASGQSASGQSASG